MAVPLQATQGYGMSQEDDKEDDDEEAGVDEAVRRAPIWQIGTRLSSTAGRKRMTRGETTTTR